MLVLPIPTLSRVLQDVAGRCCAIRDQARFAAFPDGLRPERSRGVARDAARFMSAMRSWASTFRLSESLAMMRSPGTRRISSRFIRLSRRISQSTGVHASVRGRRGGRQYDAGSMQFRCAHVIGVLDMVGISPERGSPGTASGGDLESPRSGGVWNV